MLGFCWSHSRRNVPWPSAPKYARSRARGGHEIGVTGLELLVESARAWKNGPPDSSLSSFHLVLPLQPHVDRAATHFHGAGPDFLDRFSPEDPGCSLHVDPRGLTAHFCKRSRGSPTRLSVVTLRNRSLSRRSSNFCPGSRMFQQIRLRALALSVLLVLFSSSPLDAQQETARSMDDIRAAKRVTALRISEPIQVDGILDEPAWTRADPAQEFYQQLPDEYEFATRPTQVWFLYDDEMLYVGAMLYDDPDGLITNDLRRDFLGMQTDSFGLILDTFLDRQNSYGFLTNPGGAKRDVVNADFGRFHDPNWNGVWDVGTAVVDDGWSLEFAIPFRTLRFPDRPSQQWGLNLMRNARGINERSTWAPVPRQVTHWNVSYAGTLVGITGVRPGRNFYITPFATARVTEGVEGEPGWNADGDGGVDFKWGITPSLLLDGTWRTDFSQVEVDEQQINLTRFSLFFPEKRQFFLEGPQNFQIGLHERGGENNFVPFFTRSIGLSGGQPVPVIGGARLTGRAGRQTIGVLNIQTDDFEGHPGDNFTAMVLRRTLSNTTSIAGFYFGRESKGPDSFNRVGGFDFRFSPRRTFNVEAFAMRSGTASQAGDWAGRTGFLLNGNRHTARLALLHVGDSFRHDLGFVRRRGIGTVSASYTYTLRPEDQSGHVREYAMEASAEGTSDDEYSRLLTRIGGLRYRMGFSDGGSISASVNTTFERLAAPFDIGPLTVPEGEYSFEDVELSYSSNQSAALSGRISFGGGEFWTGRERRVNGNLRLRINAKFATNATFRRSVVTLPQGSFTADLVGVRLAASFTPRMFLNVFIQYNGETEAWLTNIRFNLIHRPLSNIYLVWNDTRVLGNAQRALMLKYTHLVSF